MYVLVPHQGNFSLQQQGLDRKTTANQHVGLWSPVLNNTPTKQFWETYDSDSIA